MGMLFNDKSEKSRFIYKPNPLDTNGYQILEHKCGQADYTPIGRYIKLDSNEDSDITEAKMVNIIALMNGKGIQVDLSSRLDTRLLYQVLPRKADDDPTKIMFRTYDGSGVSIENALLEVERGVFDA